MQSDNIIPIALSEQNLSFEDPRSWKRLGLIVLATDLTSERDFTRILPRDQAAIYTSRVRFENPATPENLRHMAPRLGEAAALILPGEQIDAICYSCTAASVLIGDAAVTRAIQDVHPEVPVITPAKAARQAFAALNVRRIAILTPYLVETSRPMATYFSEHCLQVTRFECFGLEDDRIMARVQRENIIQAACRIDSPDAEAIFISCTGLPSVAAIAEIELRTGKPVITSNQATTWAMMHYAGLEHRVQGYGCLYSYPLPKSEE